MLIKILLSLIIILSAAAVGYLLAYRYTQRLQQLKSLYVSFQLLETEILYASTILPLALKRVGEKSNPFIKNIFIDTYKILYSKRGYSIEEAWSKAIKNNYASTSLTHEDMEALIDFGNNLGATDKENQIKNFSLIYLQLEKQQQIASSLKIKNERMYKSLGILIGIALVIVCI